MTADDWPDKRRETAYEEARAVLEEQNDTMKDIDEKAMRTVRLTAIIIGLLITGYQYDALTFDTWGLRGAMAALVVSIIAGVATYDESNLFVGPDGEYIEELAGDTNYSDGWGADLLNTYAGMISENYDDIQRNARFLRVTNALLIIGILAGIYSVVI